jgi:hypothetical protein
LLYIYINKAIIRNSFLVMIGRVYKITNSDESIVYVGSTSKTLKERWCKHKKAFNQWIKGKGHPCSIYHHFQERGVDNFEIQLISVHEVDNRRQLCEFEQLVIDRSNCVNKNAALGSEERTRESHRVSQRAYYQRHKEDLKESKKERDARYYVANRERLISRSRQYEKANNFPIHCECGSTHRKAGQKAHERTMKHQHWVEQQQS